MLKINKSLAALLLFLAICNTSWGQGRKIPHSPLYVFDQDSLSGFEEEAARKSAISEGFLGAEFKVRMFQLKRTYINNKYNLVRPIPVNPNPQYTSRTLVVPGCMNEDFEASANGTITTSSAISGWVLSGGTNDPAAPGNSGANSCNLIGCCTSPPSQSAIFTTPFNDPTIGSQYPIYSVFGTSTVNTAAANAANPQITTPMFGNKVIRINDDNNDYSIEKLSKTFAVTANNALFQFAFLSVFATTHPCCDAGAFRIRLYNASGGNTLIPCPTFSVSAPSTGIGGCPAGPGTPNYYIQNSVTQYTGSSSSIVIYNPWQISSIDLTPYVNSNITIEIIVTDCNAGGHFGYIYFDAQCGPMTIYGNGTAYPSSATTATVPTCGAAGATLCAADGLGPYSWSGPGVVAPYTTPSFANQCYTTNLSGTFTLYMNPAGSCNPISRVISSTITPAPLLVGSVAQAVCGNTTAIVTLTPSGSAAVPSSITWTPAPLTMNSNSLSGTYPIPTGANPAYVTTITATDPLGCKVVINPTINPAAPIPTFTIVNVTGPSSITCANSFVNLVAHSSYTYGTLVYTWNSANTFSTGDNIEIFTPGVFTITATDPVSMCSTVQHYTIGLNTTPPSTALSPTLQNVTCLTGIQTVSASATPTLNITHYFYSAQGGTVSVSSHTAIYQPAVGSHTYVLKNEVTGCYITQGFTVTSSDNFPILNVSSANNFTLGCGTHSTAAITITGAAVPNPAGAISYTLLPPSPPVTYAFGGVQQYVVSTPGVWTAVIKDNSNQCQTKVQFSVILDNIGPDIGADVPLSTLSCSTPSTVLTATTAYGHAAFAWVYPGTSGTVTTVNPVLPITVTTNTSSTLVANYTLTIQNLDNGCFSTLVIPIKQNLFPPKPVIGGTFSLTCTTPSVGLTNGSSTGIPLAAGFPTNQPIVASWAGPSPQATLEAGNYTGFVPGPYSMTVTDLNNGCTAKTSSLVADRRDYPVVNIPPPPPDTLDCGAPKKISARITGSLTNLSYKWSGPSTASLGATNTASLTIYQAGTYNVIVRNLISGCFASGEVLVVNGSLSGDFQPDVTSGYAPLTVNFNNTSHSSNPATGSQSIISVWNYGNGTSSTYSTTTNGAAVYTQPGTYTVVLYTAKGTCTDVDVHTVTVDIPSKLEVPNVFTPNGDGVNDLFFLKVANLTEINAIIFDRWGHKVYEITSATGNIAWDGTNMVGSKVAAGVYFYVIKGKGKDDKSYDTKGTINLYK